MGEDIGNSYQIRVNNKNVDEPIEFNNNNK